MNQDLLASLHQLRSCRLLIVGDVMLDRYVRGEADRISPEAPVIVLRAEDEEVRLGGAGGVASFARGLGAEVSLATVIGSDGAQFNFVGRTNGGQPDRTEAHTITTEQSEAILKAAEDSEGVELTAGSVSTASGRRAEVLTLELHRTPSGENYSTGPRLNFLPIISPDGQSVQMVITAQLNYLLPVPLH